MLNLLTFSFYNPYSHTSSWFSSISKIDRIGSVVFIKGRWRIRVLSIFWILNQASILFSEVILLYSTFSLRSISNVQPRTPSISRLNYLVFVTPVSCIFFATSSNSNMLERRHMTRKQYLLTFPSPSTLSQWFQLIEGDMILLHLTTCTVVLLNFFLFFHLTLWLGIFPRHIIFKCLTLWASSSSAIRSICFFLISLLFLLPPCKSRNYSICGSMLSSRLRICKMKLDPSRNWCLLSAMIASPLSIFCRWTQLDNIAIPWLNRQ